MGRNGGNGWTQKQQRIAAERREINERRLKNALWIIALVVVIGGTMTSLVLGSMPGFGICAFIGLVCFTIGMREPGQRGIWQAYGRQGLALPFACMLGGWLFGTTSQFAAATIIGFVIYGAIDILHRRRVLARA